MFINNSPEKCLRHYFKAWKKQDVTKAFGLCQLTWQSANAISGKTWLKNLFDKWDIIEFEILSLIYPFKTDMLADVTVRMKCRFYVQDSNTKKREFAYEKYLITGCRLIKEIAPYTPSSKGQWGVNPISILRTEEDNG